MSKDSVVHGIIEKRRLVDFIEVLYSKPTGLDTPLVQEARLHFDDDGIHARAVDAASVAMINPADFAARGFEAYEAPGRVTIAVDLKRVIDKLGPGSSDALVEFDVDMETRTLHLHYGNADVTVAMFDPDSVRSEPDTPDLDLPNTVTLSGEQLDHAAGVVDMVSDHIAIECDPDKREVRFVGEGDIEDATVTYGDEDLDDPTTVDTTSMSLFSINYFRMLAKPVPDDSAVTLQLGEEFPMIWDWSAYDGELTVHQMCAPRIQSR